MRRDVPIVNSRIVRGVIRIETCGKLPTNEMIGYEERGVKTANGKIQKEQEQSEAQPDGA
jgi:hypothetical protein